eukprot:419767-Lingulodinium_polyedra.AAC.1
MTRAEMMAHTNGVGPHAQEAWYRPYVYAQWGPRSPRPPPARPPWRTQPRKPTARQGRQIS